MNKQIAVLLNNNGQLSQFPEIDKIEIYKKTDVDWKLEKSMEFSSGNICDMESMRKSLEKIAEFLGECKILAAKKVNGILYNTMEKIGVNSWEISQNSNDYLDYILQKEEEEQVKLEKLSLERKKEGSWIVKEDDENGYFVDLIKVQSENLGITTKQILFPILKSNKFHKLVINCSHVPRWFESEFQRLNLKYSINQKNVNKYEVVVIPQ